MKYIDKAGFELEGGWSETFYRKIRDTDARFDCHSDNSISEVDGLAVEIVSLPVYPELAVGLIEYLGENIADANKSCGFHIHLSFTRKDYYMSLMSKEFFDHFVTETRKLAKETKDKDLENRFSNTFCDAKIEPFYIDAQYLSKSKNSERYKAVNFCFNQHKTVEFRIFPSVCDKERLVRYYNHTLNVVRDWIKTHKIGEFETKEQLSQVTEQIIVIPEAKRGALYVRN